jgi:sigma-E factor negative regulatory protein RseA
MSTDSMPSPDERRAALSALMDGDAHACDAVCGSWRTDTAARADWHAYHLIGDLMRSDEHRVDATRDALMLARVREQLRREPVVLAPAPAPVAVPAFAQKRRARAWMVPTAVAAGFVAVAGALVVTRVGAPAGGADDRPSLVAAPSLPATGTRQVAQGATGNAVAPSPTETVPAMIRNAELDRYLAAHRQYGALQVAPGGVVRQAAVAAPGR